VPEGLVSSALLEAPPRVCASGEAAPDAGGSRITLEQRLEAAWRSAQRNGTTDCPVCQAAMRAEGATAQCGQCGSVLS
jgi:hypothetical protein